MTALDPLDLELLYFLCAASHHHCRVVRVKGPRLASLRRLREAGFVGADDFIPSPNTIADWLRLRSVLVPAAIETPAGDQIPALAEPPAPKAVDEGGRRRCSDAGAPPPIDLDRLLSCFGDEFEQLIFVARRHGSTSTAKIVRHARTLLERGLVEQAGPINGRPHCLWRRKQQDIRGTSGAHGGGLERAPEGGLSNGPAQQRKSRTPDTAASTPSPEVASPSVDPPTVAPTAEGGAALNKGPTARPRSERSKIDIKVNARRDPTQAPPGYQSRPGAVDLTDAVIRTAQAKSSPKRKQILGEAASRNAAGKSSGEHGVSVHVRMAQRALAEQDADAIRLACPIEQAKALIRRAKRCAVFGAEVSGGPAGKFYVGTRLVDEAELLAMAKRLAA